MKNTNMEEERRPRSLTADEKERCTEMRIVGYTYQQIADELGRDVKTIRNYLRKLEKEHDKEMLEHYTGVMALRHRQYEKVLAAHWKAGLADVKTAYLVMNAIHELTEIEGLTHRYLKELEREKQEKEKSKGYLITIVHEHHDDDGPISGVCSTAGN